MHLPKTDIGGPNAIPDIGRGSPRGIFWCNAYQRWGRRYISRPANARGPTEARRTGRQDAGRRRPSETLRASITALFDRRMGFPTSARSSMCSVIRSEKVRGGSLGRARLTGISLSIERSTSLAHSSASCRRRNVLATYCRFRRTWTRQLPDSSLAYVAIVCALGFNFVCAPCAPRDQNAVQACAILASLECTRGAHVPVIVL